MKTLTYVVYFIVQIFTVLVTSVHLREDISDHLVLGVFSSAVFSLVSRRKLEQLRHRCLSITVLMFTSLTTKTIEPTTTFANGHSRETLLPVMGKVHHGGLWVMCEHCSMWRSWDLEQVRQLQ